MDQVYADLLAVHHSALVLTFLNHQKSQPRRPASPPARQPACGFVILSMVNLKVYSELSAGDGDPPSGLIRKLCPLRGHLLNQAAQWLVQHWRSLVSFVMVDEYLLRDDDQLSKTLSRNEPCSSTRKSQENRWCQPSDASRREQKSGILARSGTVE